MMTDRREEPSHFEAILVEIGREIERLGIEDCRDNPSGFVVVAASETAEDGDRYVPDDWVDIHDGEHHFVGPATEILAALESVELGDDEDHEDYLDPLWDAIRDFPESYDLTEAQEQDREDRLLRLKAWADSWQPPEGFRIDSGLNGATITKGDRGTYVIWTLDEIPSQEALNWILATK